MIVFQWTEMVVIMKVSIIGLVYNVVIMDFL